MNKRSDVCNIFHKFATLFTFNSNTLLLDIRQTIDFIDAKYVANIYILLLSRGKNLISNHNDSKIYG